ncbi:hypothetical protein QFC24_005302 [Naganishia onofrii]|uniref:Uncharacterized protein n=1 Tax=Naganishia onofrii TaxID=1851511 RepID=A0ACC2X9Q7_9TREE|nr:hypothetical protein QFC24_005302 [Naganishia onofrii]
MAGTSSSYTSAFLDLGALPFAGGTPFHQSAYGAANPNERDDDNPSDCNVAGRDFSTTAPVVRSPRTLPSTLSRSADLRIRHELMAKAAEGRHRERIDFVEGRMDCDGWPQDLVRNLLELHWNRQHHAFLITYRPSFMRDMACNGPFFSKILLNAILYGVAKFSDRPELQYPEINGGKGFLSRATTLLGSALLHPDYTVVQALLLLCNSLGAQGCSTNAPILYLRIGGVEAVTPAFVELVD